MYSRLCRQGSQPVLHHWAESTEAFAAVDNESGLVGISGSLKDQSKTRDVTIVLADHLGRLAAEPVSDEELDRARNMLECSVLISALIPSRCVRKIWSDRSPHSPSRTGLREDMHTACARIIEAVTKSIKKLTHYVFN